MMKRQIQEASMAISLFRCFNRWYSCLRQRLIYIYQHSHLFRLTKTFREKIKICFSYSFLGRIIEPRETPLGILDSSRFRQYLVSFLERRKRRLIHYLKTSLIVVLAADTKEQLTFFPVRIVGIIAVTTITINAVLSIVLKKQICLWGWLIRGLFLFAACAILSCKANWPTVKSSSILLRKL